jgi:enoyl-CoA hydratase/carnithine racemase
MDMLNEQNRRTSMGTIDVHHDGGVATIIISDPPQNRLGLDLVQRLSAAVDSIDASTARVLMIGGAGDHFSFGADLAEWLDTDVAGIRRYLVRLNQLYQQVEGLQIPTIAVVRGACMGGGFELALHCDLIVAARDAQFRFPEATIALCPLGGGLQRLAERAGRAQAARMALLSDPLSGADAHQLGMIARLAEPADVADVADDLASQLAEGPALAYAASKAILKGWSQGGLGVADRLLLDIGDTVLNSHDFARGVPNAVDAIRRNVPRPSIVYNGQ